MMSSKQSQRVEWISVLLCWIMLTVNGPWMVNGDLSCYSGTVNIINGELSVASTSSIVSQQCSEPPTTAQPSTPTTKVNSTVPLATAQPTPNTTISGNETTPTSATGSRTAGGLTTPSMTPQLTPNTTNSTVTPSATNGMSTAPLGPIIQTTATITLMSTNGTSKAPSGATPGATSATGGSVVGCVVTKSYSGSSKNNLTASFSCPAPDSPCGGIGFNGSTGAENRTECCVGALCNTLDSFIMNENIIYSTVDSCFVGSTDAIETPCGNSSNMCLTITETIQDGNTSYYCGNDTLQSYCEQDGALREGSFKQEDKNITVRCCGTTNCNTPTRPSTPPSSPTPATPSMATPLSTTGLPSMATPLSTGTPSSAGTPLPPFTPLITATGSSPMATSGSTSIILSTGAPKTSSEPAAPAMHSNKTLIIGIVAAFVVGLLGGVIVTVICCRRRKNSAARPGELLAFDSFHYKRMGADEVNEEVFMS